jgi:hypothetical protein
VAEEQLIFVEDFVRYHLSKKLQNKTRQIVAEMNTAIQASPTITTAAAKKQNITRSKKY